MEVSAEVRSIERDAVTVEYEFGETLEEMVELFGEDVVANRAKAAMVIDLQAGIRRHMVDQTDKDGNVTTPAKSDDEIQAWAASWKPGVKRVARKSAKEKLQELLSGMTPEQRAALLESALEDDDE